MTIYSFVASLGRAIILEPEFSKPAGDFAVAEAGESARFSGRADRDGHLRRRSVGKSGRQRIAMGDERLDQSARDISGDLHGFSDRAALGHQTFQRIGSRQVPSLRQRFYPERKEVFPLTRACVHDRRLCFSDAFVKSQEYAA